MHGKRLSLDALCSILVAKAVGSGFERRARRKGVVVQTPVTPITGEGKRPISRRLVKGTGAMNCVEAHRSY